MIVIYIWSKNKHHPHLFVNKNEIIIVINQVCVDHKLAPIGELDPLHRTADPPFHIILHQAF